MSRVSLPSRHYLKKMKPFEHLNQSTMFLSLILQLSSDLQKRILHYLESKLISSLILKNFYHHRHHQCHYFLGISRGATHWIPHFDLKSKILRKTHRFRRDHKHHLILLRFQSIKRRILGEFQRKFHKKPFLPWTNWRNKIFKNRLMLEGKRRMEVFVRRWKA